MYETDGREDRSSQEALQEQLRQLKSENAELRKYVERCQDSLAQKEAQLREQDFLMKNQIALANHRTEQIQVKYDALAGSKLGRLMLKIWALRKELQTYRVRYGRLFLFHWLFRRLKGTAPKVKGAAPKAKGAAPVAELPAMTAEQENWVNGYMARIAAIPDSNGCRYYQKLPYRIGLICDEFFYESISAAADFVFLTPDNWQQELDQGLDAMLFVTAWRGLHQEWRGLGSVSDMDRNPMRRLALQILDSCSDRKIPTVFYSKEDPPNYDVFVEYARHCDFICTTAKECIPRYRKDCSREQVSAVSFGINPVEHNPIGFHGRDKEDFVLFSGSWMLKYPDRCKELAVIFDGILESGHGLHIIDRNYPGNPKYCFPEKYYPYASPALPHNILQKVHKLFDWAVNINSVKGSQTMFANRAFELQANGVLMMSNLSIGVNHLLPTVQMVHDSDEVARILDAMTDEERYERQIFGIRSVMTGHTCFDRIAELLRPVGLELDQPVRRILVLADELTDNVRMCFDRQTYSEKVLACAASVSSQDVQEFDMVAWFDPAGSYGPFYLEDLANGFKYTACDYITKAAYLEAGTLREGTEHGYVSFMPSKYRTLFWREAYTPEFLLTLRGGCELKNGYSIDHFQYDAAPAAREPRKREYLLSVIVPVCNQAGHLYGKCFASLRRSSLFRDMEILFVDGSGADSAARKLETYLADCYKNIRVLELPENSEFSVAAAYRMGAEAASAPYAAFLNPEDEAVCDGYAKLYQTAAEKKCDLVLANMYRCAENKHLLDNCGLFTGAVGQAFVENGIGSALSEGRCASVRVQSLLIRTEQLSGQDPSDPLFVERLLHSAGRICAVDVPVCAEYAKTADKALVP